MTVDEVRERAQLVIRVGNSDPQYAHISEDELHEDVLRAIANGASNAAELAPEALVTSDAEFYRWYA